MTKTKMINCVELKRSIQRRHLDEYKNLSDREIGDRIQEKLAQSDSPVAEWYRRVTNLRDTEGTSPRF